MSVCERERDFVSVCSPEILGKVQKEHGGG
jgi:hypothetical protein